LPHCPIAKAPAFLPSKQEIQRTAPAFSSRQPLSSAEERDVDPLKEQEPAVFADRSGRVDCDRHPDQLNQLAAICPGHLQEIGPAPLMGKHRLLLLIAGLAVVVALGILTG
jgi:hypothetical protein